jgi:hypothetical protein
MESQQHLAHQVEQLGQAVQSQEVLLAELLLLAA